MTRPAARRSIRTAAAAALAATAVVSLTAGTTDVTTDVTTVAGTHTGTGARTVAVEAVHDSGPGTALQHTDLAQASTGGTGSSSARGYAMLSNSVALPAGGLTVLVDPKAAHGSALVSLAKTVVAAQHAAGVEIRYGGRGTTTRTGKAVVISTNQSGCTKNVLGITAVGYYTSGGTTIMDASAVHICTVVWKRSADTRRAVLLHELGHATGLTHFNTTVGGDKQIMNSAVQPQDPRYQTGDTRGLKNIAARTAALHH